jgi:hypothetical protein
VRIAHPIGGRPSPDQFGKVFHVASPIQDQIGVITPSSLHYIATTRGSYMPDIDPKTHTVMIHGLVDQVPDHPVISAIIEMSLDRGQYFNIY